MKIFTYTHVLDFEEDERNFRKLCLSRMNQIVVKLGETRYIEGSTVNVFMKFSICFS
jgi:hypothetical protein